MGKLDKQTKASLKAEINRNIKAMILEEDPNKIRQLSERVKELSNLLTPDWKVSPDTLMIVGGNLLGIVLILNFEKLDIISTKALGFVLRGRV